MSCRTEFAVNRGSDVILSSAISVELQNNVEEPNSVTDIVDIYLPPINQSMCVYLFVTIDDVPICESNTPNIHNWFFTMLSKSILWENLNFNVSYVKEPSSFKIVLVDTLFDENIMNDLILSPFEQRQLNSANIKIVNNIRIHIKINNKTGINDQMKNNNLLPDLNYIVFQTFFKLESKFPLIFNYVSRKTYQSTKTYTPFIISTFQKSKETEVFQSRSVVTGLLKSINNCPSYIDHIAASHHGTIRRMLDNNERFPLTWFVPE